MCDIKQSGKLNNEQFALAMWFVARRLKGIEPPLTLTPEMVPPSFRSNKPSEGVVVSTLFGFFSLDLNHILNINIKSWRIFFRGKLSQKRKET